MVMLSDSVLDHCAAIVFAPDAAGSAMLVALAARLGFGHAVDYSKLATIPENAMPFYIVHGALPEAARLRLIRSIRTSKQETRKYAPIICVQTGGPRHLIVRLVEIGFDEVLFLSDPVEALARKLGEQLRRDLLFVETEHYLGPDRRRLERVDRGDSRRKAKNSGAFRKLSVTRDPETGIHVHYLT